MEPDLIADRYEMEDAIGRGGMATIYRATDLRMGRVVAVKILREVYSADPKFVTRFQREAQAASALQHPNIVQVFDYGQSAGNYFIVMELVDGMDLRQFIKREGTLSNERAIEIAHDVGLGLGLAHRRGIVHRDVKPQNILLNREGLVKLTDFGIASVYKDAEAERLTTTGMTLGTVQYYAPEQAQGEIVGPPADVYALGIVLYEMLTGRTPFDGDTPVAVAMKHIQEDPEPPSHLNPRTSPALERVILRCLQKDPRDRYRDGDALAYALEQAAQAPGRRGAAAPPGRPQFAPIGLPSNDLYPDPRPDPSGRAGSYGGPAVASGSYSGPGGSQYGMSRPGAGRGNFGDAPTYDSYADFPNGGAPPTNPAAAAEGTVPRMPWPGARPAQTDEDGEGRRNGPLTAVLIGGALTFLLLGCVLVMALTGGPSALGRLLGGGSATPTTVVATVKVPNLVGLQFDVAQSRAENIGLHVTKTEVQNNATKGQVLSQDKEPNSSVALGTAIALTVSSGPGQVKVPDFTTVPTSFTAACSTLTGPDLRLICQAGPQTNSATVPFGDVISSNPPAGTLVDPGATITLTISSGPLPTPTPTPMPKPSPTATPTPTPTATPCPTPTVTPGPTATPGGCH